MPPDDMRPGRIYQGGRGPRPPPRRIRALDSDRTRHRRRGCAILTLAVVVGSCCGGILFTWVLGLLD